MSGFTAIKARAKINIVLDILGKRDDGYHEIRTVMQTVDLCDIVTISAAEGDGIIIKTNSARVPTDKTNLSYKGAEYLKKRFNIPGGIEINIEKNIPVAAGLAGGSADCAATLKGIRNLYKLSATDDELRRIGKTFGADVPFCIEGGTFLAEGIGEKLTRLTPFPMMFVLIAKPDIEVSTAWAYNKFDISNVKTYPDVNIVKKYIYENNIKGICDNMCNSLESVTAEKYPVIKEIKNTMLEFGAIGSLMSGSGPTVFGLYIYKQDCINTLKYLRKKINLSECIVTAISNNY